MVDKKIKAQYRLKNIKNNTTLEILTKKDTSYKKFTYLLGPTINFKRYSKSSISLWHLLIDLTLKT